MVPSLALRFSRAEISRSCLAIELAFLLARIAESGMASINPLPKTGVGMRKMTLLAWSAAAKFGCARVQPGPSVRPLIVNTAWTPPRREPSGLNLKQASPTGPFNLINDGMVFDAPGLLAT